MHKLNKTHILEDSQTRLHQLKNPLIGLTGSIATGKSSVSKILKDLEFKIIDADKLVRKIYQKAETFSFISSLVPNAINQDQINFSLLRNAVFSDESIKKSVEEFIYKRLPEEFKQEVAQYAPQIDEVLVYDVPLLFEKQLQNSFDTTVLVYTSRDEQLERLMQRDHCSKEEAQKIISAQIDIEQKKSLADFIIDNSGPIENLKDEVLACLKKIIV